MSRKKCIESETIFALKSIGYRKTTAESARAHYSPRIDSAVCAIICDCGAKVGTPTAERGRGFPAESNTAYVSGPVKERYDVDRHGVPPFPVLQISGVYAPPKNGKADPVSGGLLVPAHAVSVCAGASLSFQRFLPVFSKSPSRLNAVARYDWKCSPLLLYPPSLANFSISFP